MSFTEAFSPPVQVNFPDGRSARFRRAKMREWGPVCEAIRAKRVAKAMELIGTDKTLKPEQKLAARRRAEAEDVDIYDAMSFCTRSLDGISLLLKQQMVDDGISFDEVLDLAAPPDLARVADAIVYQPIVWPESAAPLAESGNEETGNSTPPESDTSTTATPANSPTDSSSTTPTAA